MWHLIEGYPVGVVVEMNTTEPYTVHLTQLPGCGARGTSLEEAIERLGVVAPRFIALLKEAGVAVPDPVDAPSVQVGTLQWFTTKDNVPIALERLVSKSAMTVESATVAA